eukprot:7493032-Pyramimonas_sp.AAC.2
MALNVHTVALVKWQRLFAPVVYPAAPAVFRTQTQSYVRGLTQPLAYIRLPYGYLRLARNVTGPYQDINPPTCNGGV